MITIKYIYTNINNFLLPYTNLLYLIQNLINLNIRYNKLVYGNYEWIKYPNSNINGKPNDLSDMSCYLHDICYLLEYNVI